MKPTLKPRNLHFWLKHYEKEANANFGDASIYTFTGVKPAYCEDDFPTYLWSKLKISEQEFNGLNSEMWNLEQKSWFTKCDRYEEKLNSMFYDMILHFSDESANLIQGFEEDFTKCSNFQGPQRELLKLVKEGISRGEREKEEESSEGSHRQWDARGKVHDIHDHNRLFKDLLDDTKEIGIVIEETDIVDMYLKSVGNTLIEADLARIKVENSTEMPTTLENAQFWAIEANRHNQDIKNNRPNAQNKRKVADLPVPERVNTADTTPDNPECAFCKKKHQGGAQECAYLKQHLEDHPEEVTDTLAKTVSYPSSKRHTSRWQRWWQRRPRWQRWPWWWPRQWSRWQRWSQWSRKRWR